MVLHSGLNLLGLGLPVVVALFAYPVLTSALGAPRFGALTLIWALAGYAGVLDLGLGRALTQIASRYLAAGNEHAVRSATVTAAAFSVVAGLVIGLLGSTLAAGLADLVGIGGDLHAEATRSVRLVLFGLPVLVLAPTLRGLLEARRLFPALAAVRAVAGSLSFVGPAVAVVWTTDLAVLTLVTLAARAIEVIAYVFMTAASTDLRRADVAALDLQRLRELLSVGGWMSVSNVVAPLMLQFDRFLVGNLLSLSAVAYYATPQSVVTRLQLVPRAVMGVLFPELSRAVASDPRRADRLSRRATSVLLGIMALPCVVLFVWAEPLLQAWLGEEFATNGATVTRLLAIGVLVHTAGQVPFSLLQAAGKARFTALVHLVEAPVYVAYLYILTSRYGIEGTAIAWVLRVTLSALVLTAASRRLDLARRTGVPAT